MYGKTHSKETILKIKEKCRIASTGKNNPFYNKTHSRKAIKILSDKAKRRLKNPKNNPNYNNKWTDEQKKNLSIKAKERYRNGFIHPFKGKHHNLEQLNRIKKGTKKAMEDPEIRKIISIKAKERLKDPRNNPAFKWVYFLVNPQGKKYDNVYNIRYFCKEHNLNFIGLISSIKRNVRSNYGKWTTYRKLFVK